MTTGELRDKLRTLLIEIDEKAADKRRERAESNACVRLYGTDDHTATLAGQNLPSAHAAAARARICAIAAALKTAGMPGCSDLIQAQVFIGLLLGTLPQVPPPAADGTGEDGPAPATSAPNAAPITSSSSSPAGNSTSTSPPASSPGPRQPASHTPSPPTATPSE
jgi:hypothetical protein